MTLDIWIRDTAERAVSSFVQAVLVFLTAGEALNTSWVEGLVLASIPPLLAVVMNAVPQLVYRGGSWPVDAVYRVARSSVQAFCAALLASATGLADLTVWRAATVTAGMAALTAIKTVIASKVPGTITPASLAVA